jgi:Domain of unknown function (DUF4292)
MRYLFSILLLMALVSCKSTQKIIPTEAPLGNSKNETVSSIIKKHYALKSDFKTAFFKANIDYADDKRSMSLSSDIRIKKDEIILVSVKLLGIVVAKAIITPTQVRYYEKINSKFFEGDYKTLSNWLGTDLDFQKVQNMMLGRAMDDLSTGQYTMTMVENAPKLEAINKEKLTKSYLFEPNFFWLTAQEINQLSPSRNLKVNYLNYKNYTEAILPGELLIFAMQNDQKTDITITYKNATFNEELNFPYSVPSGYEQITIN